MWCIFASRPAIEISWIFTTELTSPLLRRPGRRLQRREGIRRIIHLESDASRRARRIAVNTEIRDQCRGIMRKWTAIASKAVAHYPILAEMTSQVMAETTICA
jgi:hypothetical protein